MKKLKSNLFYQVLSRIRRQRREIPIYIFCYHKVGTILLQRIFRELCYEFNWIFKSIPGKPDHIPNDADVILFQHSLLDFEILKLPYAGVRFIRDPRDIIVSGYLYHKRCHEKWCVNLNFDSSPPILFPKIPWSRQHHPEKWKNQYLELLGNKSYQENLIGMTEKDGLLFEMNHYGRWTIESMLDWNNANQNIVTVRFEELMASFDETFKRIFEHFGFSENQISKALGIAAKQDLNRQTNEQIIANPHISSHQTTKWRNYFNDEHKKAFRQLFGNALTRLGYEDF